MKIIPCTQYTPEWWEARRGVPTCSNFDRILTPKTHKLSDSADKYIYELIADRKCQTPNFFSEHRPQTPEMEYGSRTEEEARDFYAMDRGVEVEQVGFYLSDDERFGGSPDGVIAGAKGGLELKCPKRSTQVEYLHKDKMPDEYKCQVHGHLIVSGFDWWDFMSYAPGLAPFVIRVVPDAFTRELKIALEMFHEKYVAMWKRIGAGT
jgi:hypothetical protein